MSKCLYIPREINEQYILLWKRDEASCLMVPWIFTFVLGFPVGLILTLITTIILARILKMLSLDKPSGYLTHWVKFNMPKQFISSIFSKKSKLDAPESLIFRGESLPPPHIRYIAG